MQKEALMMAGLTLAFAAAGAVTVNEAQAQTALEGNSRILRCEDPDVGIFYTNAATCAEADLRNRLSSAQPLVTQPDQQRYSGRGHQTPSQQAKQAHKASQSAKKPALQAAGKSPPSGLNPGCKFAVGKALELERDLAAADDPLESTWRENYCHWRCEAIAGECGVPDSYFYYRFERLCRDNRPQDC